MAKKKKGGVIASLSASVIITIVLYLIPKKTPAITVILLVFLAASLITAVLKTAWISDAAKFTTKVVRFVFALAFILSAVFLFGWYVWPEPQIPLPQLPSPPVSEIHPYDLSAYREELFLKFLEKKQAGPREVVRIGCVSWSERACVAAGRFLIEFSKAGWIIDSKRVFRMEVGIPTRGVSICTNKPVPPSLPPHLGVWQQMSPSHLTVNCAFWEIGIPVTGSSDPALPTGTLGVYFGPEPSNLIAMDETARKLMCEKPSSEKAGP